jgi:hypothetical protein
VLNSSIVAGSGTAPTSALIWLVPLDGSVNGYGEIE